MEYRIKNRVDKRNGFSFRWTARQESMMDRYTANHNPVLSEIVGSEIRYTMGDSCSGLPAVFLINSAKKLSAQANGPIPPHTPEISFLLHALPARLINAHDFLCREFLLKFRKSANPDRAAAEAFIPMYENYL
jgi:hypothetical protein